MKCEIKDFGGRFKHYLVEVDGVHGTITALKDPNDTTVWAILPCGKGVCIEEVETDKFDIAFYRRHHELKQAEAVALREIYFKLLRNDVIDFYKDPMTIKPLHIQKYEEEEKLLKEVRK